VDGTAAGEESLIECNVCLAGCSGNNKALTLVGFLFLLLFFFALVGFLEVMSLFLLVVR